MVKPLRKPTRRWLWLLAPLVVAALGVFCQLGREQRQEPLTPEEGVAQEGPLVTPKAVTGANGALTEAGTNGTLTEESGVSGNDGGSAERGENEPRNKGQGGLSDGVAPAGTSSVTQLLPPNLFAASPTRIFERRAMHFERGAAAEVHADVLGLSRGKLHHTISTLPREAAEQHVTLSKAGPPQPCREDGAACVRRAKRTKATLIVNGAELLDAGVHELVSSWRRELGVFVSAGFYSTPKGKQGFLYHSDKTDVLVLQLEGSKRWEVCGRELPKLHLPPSYGECHLGGTSTTASAPGVGVGPLKPGAAPWATSWRRRRRRRASSSI